MKVTVVGSGPFPMDMLRYDACHPAAGSDANALAGREKRRVTLLNAGPRRRDWPTIARWASFGWTVVSHDARTGVERPDQECEALVNLLLGDAA